MGRMYSVQFNGVAVTAESDLFEIVPATAKPVLIHALYLSQGTDVGDTEEEMKLVRFMRGHTTSGSGGTTPTPAPLMEATIAAGFTAEANNTTVATTGSPVTLHSEYFNIRVGMVYVPTPEARIRVAPATRLVVRMAAPLDSITMAGTLVVEEI